jgi:hypothetical protein
MSMTASTTTTPWPPTMNTCPDYWTILGDGSCNVPSPLDTSVNAPTSAGWVNNTTSIAGEQYVPGYSSSRHSINFNDAGWSSPALGSSSLCAKRKWAITNTIVWDGVTNYTGC